MQHHTTREGWLQNAVEQLRPLFLSKGHVIPVGVMVSCGFPSTGLRSHHIGQCWSSKTSADARNQIFISPTLQDPVEVLDTLVHELVHAVDDCKHKHGKEFKKIALSLGMVGPMRSAGAGPKLKEQLINMAPGLGVYPHGKLQMSHRKVTAKARPKAKCEKCGYQVPMFRKFLSYGPPICPQDKTEMTPIGDWEEI